MPTKAFVAGSNHGTPQDLVQSPRNIPNMVKRQVCSYRPAETHTLHTSSKKNSQGKEMAAQGMVGPAAGYIFAWAGRHFAVTEMFGWNMSCRK